MSEKCPTVSIVVCVYNAEDYLRSCLDSVLAQTSPDWELVCVDDGSSDGSVAILNEYAQHDQRIRVFPRGKNFGLLSARKFGVSKVQGEYVMFLDNDDKLLSDAVEKLPIRARETQSDIVQVGVDFIFPKEMPEAARQLNRDFFSVRASRTYVGASAILGACFRDRVFSWNVWNKLFAAPLLRKAYGEICDEYVVVPEDAYAMFYIGAFAQRLTTIQKPYYLYRVASGVSMGCHSDIKAVREIEAILLTFERIRSFLKGHEELQTGSAFYHYRKFFCHYYIPDCMSRIGNREEVLRLTQLSLDSQCSDDQIFLSYQMVLHDTNSEHIRLSDERNRLIHQGGAQDRQLIDSAYFDSKWYLEQYADVADSGMDPVMHYLRYGWKEGRNPSAHFDTNYYLSQHPVLHSADVCPLIHYLEDGIETGRLPLCLEEVPSLEDFCLLADTDLFDADYYCGQLAGGVCVGPPIVHYLVVGWRQGLSPSQRFNTNVYLALNPDVGKCGIAPLLHYLRNGKDEGRLVFPDGHELICNSGYFDEKYYVTQCGGALEGMDPASHYLLKGWRLGYDPSESFSQRDYVRFYLDLRQLEMPALLHYLRNGKTEGRNPFARVSGPKWIYPDGFDVQAFRSRKDKVLVITHQLDHTGVPVLSKQIATLFPRRSVVLSPMDGPLAEACLEAGVPVVIDQAFFVGGGGVETYQRLGFTSCLFNCVILAEVFLGAYRRMASILWVHDNVDRNFFPDDLKDRFATMTNIYATSSVTRRYVQTYSPLVSFLPYPVFDQERRARTKVPEIFHFAIVARIEPRKGQDVAIRAIKKLPPDLKCRFDLTIVGSFISEDFKRDLLQMAFGEPVSFKGVVSDNVAYHSLYRDIDVLICPSREDPMPLVVLDAMMHGCPVIVSDHVGEKDFVENGVNGYVFKSEDEEELRAAIEKMIAHRTSYPAMSASIRKTFEQNFDERTARKAIEKALASAKEYVGGCR